MIEKVNLQQTLDRRLAFVERRMQHGILAEVSHPVSDSGPDHPGAAESAEVRGCLALENPDACLSSARDKANRLQDSLSDSIPTAYPTLHFGESVWAGIMGADITFAGVRTHTWSNCEDRPVKDLSAFDYPLLNMENVWVNRMLDVTRRFAAHMDPVCDVTPFIILDCLNLLVELRGAGAYTDVHDHPELLGRFMDWSIEVNMRLYDAQASLLADFADVAYGWHPFGRYSRARIPSLSVDAYGLCRPDVYARWGLDQHTRLVAHYGGARLHIHGSGRRLCELVSRNDGITYCSMTNDAGYPEAWTIVDELKERMSPIPIGVAIPKNPFLERLRARALPGGVLYRVSADSLDEANEMMQSVFEYSPRTVN